MICQISDISPTVPTETTPMNTPMIAPTIGPTYGITFSTEEISQTTIASLSDTPIILSPMVTKISIIDDSQNIPTKYLSSSLLIEQSDLLILSS